MGIQATLLVDVAVDEGAVRDSVLPRACSKLVCISLYGDVEETVFDDMGESLCLRARDVVNRDGKDWVFIWLDDAGFVKNASMGINRFLDMGKE